MGIQGKEPWQMTRLEWLAEMEKGRPSSSGSHCITAAAAIGRSVKGANSAFEQLVARKRELKMGLGDFDATTGLPWTKEAQSDGLRRAATHYDVIKHAMALGMPIPDHVLADYPDFAVAQKRGGA